MNFKHIYNNEKKNIKYKNTHFNYITTSEFEKNDTFTSLGYLKPLKTTEADSTSIKILEVENSDTKFQITNKKPFLHKVSYYVNIVDNNDESKDNLYVAISKFNIVPILFYMLLLAVVCVVLVKTSQPNPVKSIYENITDADGLVDERPVTNNKPDELLKPGEMAVPGYTNLYITKGGAVYLNNPKGNEVTFKYVIKLSGEDEVLFESKDIPAGKADMWYPELNAGKYSVDFYIQVTRKDGSKGVTPYLPNINLEVYN